MMKSILRDLTASLDVDTGTCNYKLNGLVVASCSHEPEKEESWVNVQIGDCLVRSCLWKSPGDRLHLSLFEFDSDGRYTTLSSMIPILDLNLIGLKSLAHSKAIDTCQHTTPVLKAS
jgi:hypothetical protein